MQQLRAVEGSLNGMPKLPALATLRQSRFWTQEQLAKKAQVARSTIAELELQERPARFTTMKKLADALGCDMLELVHGQPPKPARRGRRPKVASDPAT